MHELTVETRIDTPAERCFDLARSVDAHVATTRQTGERAIAGKTSGLLELGDEVTWQARHFSVRQRLTSRMTAFDRPVYFQDRMTRGAFRFLEHDHHFVISANGGTTMLDVLRFESPGWLAAGLLERFLLGPHLERFLIERGEQLKAIAESQHWQRYLPV